MKAKLGPQAGISATAHKIAVIFFSLVTNQREYDESIWKKQDVQRARKKEARLKRHAHEMGYQLVSLPATA